MVTERKPTDSHTIELGEHQSIRNVVELHHELMEVALLPEEVAIDAGRVAKIDTAAMQALLSFCQERRRHDHAVRWVAVSDRFRTVASGLGLAEALGVARMA